MTSAAAESVSTILVSCKQTRFHIENPNYRELDIEGLNITVTSGGDKPTGKGKGKAKAEGTEILSGAKLRLKAGQRYALVGRNGSGKSSLLRAIAEKLIPGIPEQTRIALLQQTRADETAIDAASKTSSSEEKPQGSSRGRVVLEDVIENATAKGDLEQEIAMLSDGVNDNTSPYSALRALRKLRHERMQKRLFVLDKDIRLRSGTRGLQARKALVEQEKTVAESAALLEQTEEEISAETLEAETQEAIDLLAELQLQVEPSRMAEVESSAKKILTGLGFSEADMAKPVSSLSGGWRMRTALATVLLQECDILILDEPTNFLDLLGIIWLQRHLESLEDGSSGNDVSPTLILVSHDRDFVGLCTDLLILKDQDLTYFHGSLAAYEAAQSERKLYLTKMKEAQDKQKAHIQETIRQNMAQGRKSDDANKIRQAKSRQKKLDERWGLEVGARGGRFKLNRDLEGFHLTSRAAIEVPQDERAISIVLPDPPALRFPGALISLENVAFRYPGKTSSKTTAAAPAPTLSDVTFSVHIGDRVGILGLNGAGKSTLIRLLVGAVPPTSGTVTTHPRLRLGYYSQHAVEELQNLGRAEPTLTALGLLMRDVAGTSGSADGSEGKLDEGAVRALLGGLGLPGRVASDVPLAKLSGGQLVRCELARVLWRRPQVLVLDEVTTHLDYGTVGALRTALRAWEGAVVLVSHDRWFMRGAVEGVMRDEGSEAGDEEADEDERERESLRRRVVYRLRGGKLVLLEGGVREFEESMEKRVAKLLDG